MAWKNSFDTFIWIFSVGRGNAAFIRTGLNQAFIIDMASRSDPGFSPADFIEKHFIPHVSEYEKRRIAQAVLSHPHLDHISECGRLVDGAKLSPKLLTCPNDRDENGGRERINWKRIKNPEGSQSVIDQYKGLYSTRQLPLQTICFDNKRTIHDLEYGIYYIRPPKCEQLHSDDSQYGNAMSMMFYLRYGTNSILLPGDMTPEGMAHVLRQAEGTEKRYTVFSRAWTNEHPLWHKETCDQPPLEWLLKQRGLSILVAPHHGLKSCYSPELYAKIKGGKPQLVVISEEDHTSNTDGEVHPNYQCDQGASGLAVEIDGNPEKDRKSVSTRDGRHILIVFNGRGVPRVFADRNPARLLAKMDQQAAGAVV